MSRQRNETLIALLLSGIAVYLLFTRSGQQVAANIAAQAEEGIMELSDSGLQLIASFEGFSATPYADAQGQSIGYGHFILPGELGSTIIPPITQAQGLALLQQDAGIAENAVANLVTVPLSQNQYDALVSLVYNIGQGNFAHSTLLRDLNARDYDAAAAQFPLWDKSNNQVVQALVDRRASEQDLFLTA